MQKKCRIFAQRVFCVVFFELSAFQYRFLSEDFANAENIGIDEPYNMLKNDKNG